MLKLFPDLPQLSSSPFFTLSALKFFLGQFWRFPHHSLAVIHRATFCPQTASPTLLLSIIIFGSYCCDIQDAQTIFQDLAGRVRSIIISRHPQGNYPFSELQALYLVNTYQVYFGTIVQNQRCQVWDNFLFSLVVDAGCFEGIHFSNEAPSTSAADLKVRSWHKWIKEESVRRLAFGVFTRSVMHLFLTF